MKIFQKYNIPLILLPFLIFVIGFITHFSTSPERGRMHLVFFAVGMLLLLVFSSIDYHLYLFFWKYIYIVGLGLLTATYLFGEIRLGASRWLDLGLFSFQPSELSKIVIVIVLSSFIFIKGKEIFKISNIFFSLLLVLPLLIFVYIQPDLGTSLILAGVFFGLLFYTGISKMYFLFFFLITGIFSNPIWNLLKEYQRERILVFLNPQLDVQGAGYNVIQSLIAIGSGGLFGQGFSRGTQTHLNFLPAYWTDFVFASFAEEWGLVGVLILLILYTLFIYFIILQIKNTSDSLGKLISFGILCVLIIQFFINIGMNLGLMPVTGIPLPLVSHGGSSMLVTMIMLGILQNIHIKENTKHV